MADDDAYRLPMASDDATRSECNPLLEGTITDVRIKYRNTKFSVLARNPRQTGWYSNQLLQLDNDWAPEAARWWAAIQEGPKAVEELRAWAQAEAQAIIISRSPLPVHTEPKPSVEPNADAEGSSVNVAMAMSKTQAAGQDEDSHPEHQSVPSEGIITDVEALIYFEYFVEAKQPSETGWYSFEQLRPIEELVLQASQWRHAAEQGPKAVAKLLAKAKPKASGNAKATAPSHPPPAALPQDGIVKDVRGDPKESLEFWVESEELGEPGWFSGKLFRRLPREHPLKTQMQKWQSAAEEGFDAIERLRADERLRAEAKSQADATTSASPEENTTAIGKALAMNNSQLQVKSVNKDKYGLSLLPSVALEKKDVSLDTSVPPAFQSFRPSEGEWYRQEFTKRPDVRSHKTLDLLQHYSHYYGMWIADLAAGNTVLLQGYGSKAPILAAFSRLPLFQPPNTVVVTASGAEPRISGRLIVNAICSCIKGPAVAGWSLARQLHFLHQLLGEKEVQTQAAAQEAVRACCSLPEKSTPSQPSQPWIVDGQPPDVENRAAETVGRVTPVFNNPDQNCTEGSAEASSSPPTAAPPKRVTRSQVKVPEGAFRMVLDLVDFQHAVYQQHQPGAKVKEKEVELLGGVTTRGSIDVSKPNPRVLLCISSMDHDYLWLPSALNILATLAAMPRVWLMVSLDKVDSAATIKRRDADRFQFVCYHTPTFLPFPPGYRLTRGGAAVLYGEEGEGEGEGEGGDLAAGHRGVRAVLSCITERSRNILKLIVEYQVARQQPMPEQELLTLTSGKMMAVNYPQLQSFLKECIDHRLLVLQFERTGNVYRVVRLNAVRQALESFEASELQ